MLDINIEFSKGVLFIRMSGNIKKDNSKEMEKSISNILEKSGIKYLVFNLLDLNILEDIDLFDICDKKIKENNGKMIICGNDELKFENASNELSALRMILPC